MLILSVNSFLVQTLELVSKLYSTGHSSISNMSSQKRDLKREEIREGTHELEDTKQDELEEDDDDCEDEGTE